MNRLAPTETYEQDAKVVGDDEAAPAFRAHRRLLRRLVREAPRPPRSWDGFSSYRALVREPIDEELEIQVSVIVASVPEPMIELRGLKQARKGTYFL